jgi:hypothetical protein
MKLNSIMLDLDRMDEASRAVAVPGRIYIDSASTADPSVCLDFGDRAPRALLDELVAAFNRLQAARREIEGAGRD